VLTVRTSKQFIVLIAASIIACLATQDLEASSRANDCRRTSVRLPPGHYSIVVAGFNEKDVAAAIRRVVSEEHQARPGLFANANIEVYDSQAGPPDGQRAIATIVVGDANRKPVSGTGSHLNIFVPKIYENEDPQYVKSVKLDTAGIHLAYRTLLFFSGESNATVDTMTSEHFSALPDEFVQAVHDNAHRR